MRHAKSHERRCSYVVSLERAAAGIDEIRSLAAYLSSLAVADCDIVVLDGSPGELFDEHHRVLRWVGRHLAVPAGADRVRFATEVAACEKVIVAGGQVRYTRADLDRMCALLESHEVVEPQDYFDPLPWWGGIDAGRMLVHRGIEPYPDHGATFGFRRSALRGLRGLDLERGDDHVRRLASHGAEVFSANDVFIQREPPALGDWLRERPRQADDDFSLPVKSAFFFAFLPMTLILALLGGLRIATGYAGAVAFASTVLALRGRIGAAPFFPLRTCLFAPLWVLERSLSVYWALFRKMRGVTAEPTLPVPDRARGTRVASGE
jgi:hypothetical protein